MNRNMPQAKIILPLPVSQLQTKIWSRLEVELAKPQMFDWAVWQKWLFGGLASSMLVALIGIKLLINQATQTQFNDLDTDLALTEQTILADLDVTNFEWEVNPPGGN